MQGISVICILYDKDIHHDTNSCGSTTRQLLTELATTATEGERQLHCLYLHWICHVKIESAVMEVLL